MVTVYCTATLENCPGRMWNAEYDDSIRRFLHSEYHLQENVLSGDIKHLSTRSCRKNTFEHTMSVILSVKTTRLWENPARYVQKHLSLENFGRRTKETVVKLSRIHQKE